jgi:membrane-bound lytic murein transglycosylase D
MQMKVLCVTALLVFSFHAQAQQYEKFTMDGNAKRRVKTDTTVIYTGKPASQPNTREQLQVNTHEQLFASAAPITDHVADNTPTYKPIPLAGQKSYFGEMNDYVIDFVRKYMELHNPTLNTVQNNATAPFSLIDNVLAQHHLPKELKYIAVIESALNTNAVSSAGAAGPWQLMEATARSMGLSVTRKNDDRKDWYKSTTAAAKYLSTLYGQLNDWLLVIAAYNSGPTPVQRAIAKTGSTNFWEIKPYLPRETQGYVLAFIATASIFENLSKFIGLGSIPMDFEFNKEEAPKGVAATKAVKTGTPAITRPSFTDDELKQICIVRISEPIYLELMAQQLDVDKKLLTRWNSDYDMFEYHTYPTPFYNLRIPKDKLDVFLQKKEYLTKKSKQIYGQNL